MDPLLYHAHHTRHPEDLPFWLDLARQKGDPVLELGCGTGRVLLVLAQAGHRVLGLDMDPSMLAILRQNLPASLKPPVAIWQGDLTAFCLAARFPLILLPCNTFSTLTGPQRQDTLANVRRHLQPGGVFATAIPNPDFLRQLPRIAEPELEETFPHPLDGHPVQVSNSWKRTYRSFNLTWIYDHLLPDGRVERTSAQIKHHILPTEAYLDEFRTAGLEVLSVYGDYDRTPISADAPYLIIVSANPG